MKAPYPFAVSVMAFALVSGGFFAAIRRADTKRLDRLWLAAPPAEPAAQDAGAPDAGPPLPPPPCAEEECEDRPAFLQCAGTNKWDGTCARWAVEYERHCVCYRWGNRP